LSGEDHKKIYLPSVCPKRESFDVTAKTENPRNAYCCPTKNCARKYLYTIPSGSNQLENDKYNPISVDTHREIDSDSCKIKPNLDCKYTLAPIFDGGIL